MGRSSGSGSGRAAGVRAGSPRPGTRFVSGRDLAGVRQGDGEAITATSENRKESIRQLFRSGRAGEDRVKVTVHRDGRQEVEDGRHRILVAQEPEFAHVKLKVTYSRGGAVKRTRRKR